MSEQNIPEVLMLNLEQYLVYWGTSNETMAKNPPRSKRCLGKLAVLPEF